MRWVTKTVVIHNYQIKCDYSWFVNHKKALSVFPDGE